jgi:RNA polymerase sigma-70 factor (ECF subfamily)
MDSTGRTNLFLSVIETNSGLIYKVAHAYCSNAEDRKDLLQEIIVQIWRSFDSYNSRYKYSTWMYRIALNTAISFYRKESRRKQVFDPLPDGILYFSDAHAEDEIEEKTGVLQQCIAELKALDKALLLLYLEEKSQKEIAAIMGITETNVATRMGRIRNRLKQKFSGIKK